jgi:hypothetical protein
MSSKSVDFELKHAELCIEKCTEAIYFLHLRSEQPKICMKLRESCTTLLQIVIHI